MFFSIFSRSNIFLDFVRNHPSDIEHALDWYLQLLKEKGTQTPKAIIYCRNLRSTARGFGMLHYRLHQLCKESLDKKKYSAMISEYHAELYESERIRITEEFRKISSTIRCLVSTVAFGMGMDIPDIRYVLHWGQSDSVVQQWQEVGRAGRDGASAIAITYHRGTQLRLCSQNMKDLCAEMMDKSICMRQGILRYLTLPEMPPMPNIDDKMCVCSCCAMCKI